MSYQVLARKWRPRQFDEMVGQPHVLKALIHALETERLHHAYLFTGTRGVGKTTVARILAKCLNCETGVTATPCGECSACRSIDEGRFVDLIEVDAASRTKVDDTRELLDNVQYAPTSGRYKVYLIDEVHMLSGHSFNALLKTLEEPPEHVKFLLATTDPQKLPVTVLSRCLQFNLKRMPATMIVEHLQHILGKESVESDDLGLQLIAQAADGSMRDALSLMDQAIAYGDGKVVGEAVQGMLGGVAASWLDDMLTALAANDAEQLSAVVQRLNEHAPDFNIVLRDLASLLHQIALMQTLPGISEGHLLGEERLTALASALTAEDVQLFYQIALTGRRDLEMSPDAKSGFEMTMLRMLAFRPADAAAAEKKTPAKTAAVKKKRLTPEPQAVQQPKPAINPASKPSELEAAAAPYKQPLPSVSDWDEVVTHLALTKMSKTLADNCALASVDKDQGFVLQLSRSSELMNTRASREAIIAAIKERYAVPASITLVDKEIQTPYSRREEAQRQRQTHAVDSLDDDEVVNQLKTRFGAELIPGTVRPNEK